jgi:hypothetical protein
MPRSCRSLCVTVATDSRKLKLSRVTDRAIVDREALKASSLREAIASVARFDAELQANNPTPPARVTVHSIEALSASVGLPTPDVVIASPK